MRRTNAPALGYHGRPSAFRRFLGSFRGYKKHTALCLMFLPVLAYFIIFKYIPIGGIMIAFKDYKIPLGVFGSPWNGFDNFRDVFQNPNFLRAVINTIQISLYKLVFGFPMPIIFAIFLTEVRHMPYKRTVQTISYLPHFLSWVVLYGIFYNILSPNTGMLNDVLVNWFGFDKPVYFMGNNSTFQATLVVTDIWKNVGWSSILYLAAIAGIDTALYEAAMCDGASRMQRILHITLPSLLPTITVLLILNLGFVMDAGFDQVFNFYSPAVYATGDIIDTYVYRQGMEEMKYAFSTAMGLFKNAIGFVLVLGTNFVAKRVSDNGLW